MPPLRDWILEGLGAPFSMESVLAQTLQTAQNGNRIDTIP
jgi:hypothetical protein